MVNFLYHMQSLFAMQIQIDGSLYPDQEALQN